MSVGKGPGLAARSVPKPSATVVSEAHNLLSLMGDPKRVKEPLAILAEMREVQSHNEAVAEQVRTLITDADRRIEMAGAAESKAAGERQRLADETQAASRQLSVQRSEIERAQQRLDTETAANTETASDLERRERVLTTALDAVAAINE